MTKNIFVVHKNGQQLFVENKTWKQAMRYLAAYQSVTKCVWVDAKLLGFQLILNAAGITVQSL